MNGYVCFYFTSFHPGFPSDIFHPRFVLSGIGVGEESKISRQEVLKHQTKNNLMQFLVPEQELRYYNTILEEFRKKFNDVDDYLIPATRHDDIANFKESLVNMKTRLDRALEIFTEITLSDFFSDSNSKQKEIGGLVLEDQEITSRCELFFSTYSSEQKANQGSDRKIQDDHFNEQKKTIVELIKNRSRETKTTIDYLNPFFSAFGLAAVLDRTLPGEVAKSETSLARHALHLRRLVLRYAKAFLMLIETTIIFLALGLALKSLPTVEDGFVPLPSFEFFQKYWGYSLAIILCATFWHLVTPVIVKLPILWINRDAPKNTKIKISDVHLLRFEKGVFYVTQWSWLIWFWPMLMLMISIACQSDATNILRFIGVAILFIVLGMIVVFSFIFNLYFYKTKEDGLILKTYDCIHSYFTKRKEEKGGEKEEERKTKK